MYKVLENKTYRTFSELEQHEREHFIQECAEMISGCEIRDAVEDIFDRQLEEKGLSEFDLERRWSFFNCQGDGCSVLGVITMTPELLSRFQDKVADRVKDALEREDLVLSYNIFAYNSHYVHSSTMHVSTHTDETELPNSDIDYVGELLLQYLQDMCGDIESEAYKQIDYYSSEEYAEEMCKNNGVLFDEQGKSHWGLEDELVEGERFKEVETVD